MGLNLIHLNLHWLLFVHISNVMNSYLVQLINVIDSYLVHISNVIALIIDCSYIKCDRMELIAFQLISNGISQSRTSQSLGWTHKLKKLGSLGQIASFLHYGRGICWQRFIPNRSDCRMVEHPGFRRTEGSMLSLSATNRERWQMSSEREAMDNE